jgi:hypothetical protein
LTLDYSLQLTLLPHVEQHLIERQVICEGFRARKDESVANGIEYVANKRHGRFRRSECAVAQWIYNFWAFLR